MPFDPMAAMTAAKDKREKDVNEAAGAIIVRVSEAATKAIDDGDMADLSAVLKGNAAPKAKAEDTSDDAPRAPRPKRNRGSSSGTSRSSRTRGTRGSRRTRK